MPHACFSFFIMIKCKKHQRGKTMIELENNEIVIWQASFDMYYSLGNDELDVEYLIITNKAIHLRYLQKVAPFRKEIVNKRFSISDLVFSPNGSFYTLGNEQTDRSFIIHTVDLDLSLFIVNYDPSYEKELISAAKLVKDAIERK